MFIIFANRLHSVQYHYLTPAHFILKYASAERIRKATVLRKIFNLDVTVNKTETDIM